MKDTKPLAKAFESICWSSEGKGRVTFLQNDYLFGYESLQKEEKFFWMMGLNIPLHGEEVFQLLYSRDLPSSKGAGNFYRRLLYGLKNHPQGAFYKKMLDHYLSFIGELLYKFPQLQDPAQIQQFCKLGKCQLQREKEFQWQLKADKLEVTHRIGPRHLVLLEAFDLKQGYFSRLRIALHDERANETMRYPLELNLFINSCLK